jgi:DNA-binding transcriptional MerR regulator
MFLIGEFSRIARISTRQLRHYDQLGLFKPSYTDSETGYRYYSASQLPQLNRILALKDLGLSLEQVARLMNEAISAEEIQGMLRLKQAQIEQNLREDFERVRSIEERLWEIETEGVLSDDNVVLKSMPEQEFLSIRQVVPTVSDGFLMMLQIHHLLPHVSENHLVGKFGLMFHSDGFETENIDVEMGFLLEQPFLDTFTLNDGRKLTKRKVAAIDKMATLARVGIYNDSVGHYGALGTWIEKHGYLIDGANREVFINPFIPGKENDAVLEIQIPVIEREKLA